MAAKATLLSGLVAALVTPMTEDGGSVVPEVTGRLVGCLVEAGADGFFVCGTTGESPMLEDEERLAVAREAVRGARGRVPVIVQASAGTTQHTVRLARSLQALGVQGIALVTPWYYRFRDEELVAYFTTVADSVPEMPVYLYNIPQRTGNAVSPALAETVVRRAPNVEGIKDSSGSMQQILALVALRERLAGEGRRFAVLSGDDVLALPAIGSGADGLVSGNSTVVPEPFVELLRAVSSGNAGRARQLSGLIARVAGILGNGVRLDLFKSILTRRGVPAGGVRAPALVGTEEEVARAWAELRRAFEENGLRLGPFA